MIFADYLFNLYVIGDCKLLSLQESFSLPVDFLGSFMCENFGILSSGLTVETSSNLNSTAIFGDHVAAENHRHFKLATIFGEVGHRKIVTKGGDGCHHLHYSLTRKSYSATEHESDVELTLGHL